jgi:hypothetical protein
MIDLSLDDVDQAVVEALDRVLGDAKGPGWRVEGEACVADEALLDHLTGLLVADPSAAPEERPTLLTCELAAERMGYWLVGVPMIDHLVALRYLETIGEDEARKAAGEAAGLFGLMVPAEQSRDAQPSICLSGAVAGSILRILPDGSACLLDFEGKGAAPYVPNLGDLPVGRVAMDDSRWRALADAGPEMTALALAERKILISGAIAGLCERALALAVDYANERELFGAPIGSFQSLAHGLAAAKVQTDGTQLLSREAAWARDNDLDRFFDLSRMAYAYASAAGDYVTRTAVHIFGGYGLTKEYPAQGYYRMARALTLFVGDRRFDLQKIGLGLIDGPQHDQAARA